MTILISWNSTMPVIITNSFISMGLQIIPTPSILNDYILTLPKTHMPQQTSRTSSHRWHFGLIRRKAWCIIKNTSIILSQLAHSYHQAFSFFDSQTLSKNGKTPYSLWCANWHYLLKIWCYSFYSGTFTVHYTISASGLFKSTSQNCIQIHPHSLFKTLSLSSHQIFQLLPQP